MTGAVGEDRFRVPPSDWRAWGVPAVALIAGLALWASGENRSFLLVLNGLSGVTGDGFWAGATILGDTLVALVCLAPFWGRRPDVLWAALVTALLATLWVHGLKPMFALPRPAAVLPPESLHVIGHVLRAGSFPSGHATTAFALAGVAALHLRGRGWWWLLVAVALLAGFSRSVVGAHWPLDVLAGAFGGWASAVIGGHLAGRYPLGVGPRFQGALGVLLAVGSVWLIGFHASGYPEAIWFQRGIGVTCLGWLVYRALWARRMGPM